MKQESRTILPSPDTLNNLEYGKFVLSNLAAKRAKQIKDGAPPLVRTTSNHPLSIALAEIAAGKIKPIMKMVEDSMSINFEGDSLEETRGEMGILLPALDETEAEILGAAGIMGDDSEEELDADGEGAELLSDLLEDAEVDEVVAEDENTLSLSDIAEEEESGAEEEESDGS